MKSHELDPLILEALLKLRECGEPRYDDAGVCCEVACYIERAKRCAIEWSPIYMRLSELFKGWPHHSGESQCPISEDRDYGKWEGPNAYARWSLIDYVINRLQNEDAKAL